MVAKQSAVVFVHGLFSDGSAWDKIIQLLETDPEFTGVSFHRFEYSSPRIRVSTKKAIPNFNTVADSLRTYLEVELAEARDIVLVSHSQGGIVAQRYLARMVEAGRGRELTRIRRVIMFACPNSGSQIYLPLRRAMIFWRHPQEKQLRPLDEGVIETQRAVLDRIVNAQYVQADRCPIPFRAYAGETDNVVSPQSAKSFFPSTGVIPGDHNTIIQPDSVLHRSYTTLSSNLTAALKSIPTRIEISDSTRILLRISQGELEKLMEHEMPPGSNDRGDGDARDLIVQATWSASEQPPYRIIRPEGVLQWLEDDEDGDES